MPDPARPRVLLAEDDPVSRAFLLEALRGCGLDALALDNGHDALVAAGAERFDLLILDHRLPGLDGDCVLTTLRAQARACSRESPALATSADPDPALRQLLLLAGFRDMLIKPMDAARLHAGLRNAGIAMGQSLLDDSAGLAASGNVETLAALRALFATELDTLARNMEDLCRNDTALLERLHRLHAACGFCGALALDAASIALRESVRSHDRARIGAALAAFRSSLHDTRMALAGQL